MKRGLLILALAALLAGCYRPTPILAARGPAALPAGRLVALPDAPFAALVSKGEPQ